MSVLLQPKLRFKQDDGSDFTEWEKTLLLDIAQIVGGGTPPTENEEYWNGNINWFTPSEIKDKYTFSSEKKITKLGLQKSSAKILPIGSILFTSRASIGEKSISKEDCCTNQGFQSFIVKETIDRDFIYYSISHNEKKFHRLAQGSTFKEVYKKHISKIIFFIPHLLEQNKIASFLSAVDKKIELLTKKHEQLEKYKKGLMQKIFSQEIRFKQDDGGEFSDWQNYKLKEIFEGKRGNGLSKDDISINGIHKCVLYGELYTTYSENLRNVRSKTNKECKVKSKKGDLLVPCSTTTTAIDLAVAACINEENVGIGGDITILRLTKDFSPLFFSYYLTNHKKTEIAKFAQGSTIIHLYFSHFKDILVHIPTSKEEQNKISNVIEKVDSKIDLIKQQIEKTQTFKKGLLQQMFV